MFQLAIFLILVVVLINRPLIGIGLILIGLVCWIAFVILSILWPVILALVVAAIWAYYKLRKEVVVKIQRD